MKRHFVIYIISIIYLNTYAQKAAPDFTVTDIYGHTHTLYSDYLDNDKYVFIEFFNTGCLSCQELTPKVDTVFKEFGCNYRDIIFLGIDVYSYDPNVINFANQYSMTFPGVSGNDGGGNEVFFNYGYSYTPYKIIIAPNKKIVSDNPDIYYASEIRDSLLNMGFQMQLCEGNDFIFYSVLSETDSVVGDIDYENKLIDIIMPPGTDLSNLIPTFVEAVNSTIEIDGINQISGETVTDFSNGPLIYQITSEEGIFENWTVSVQTETGINILDTNLNIYPNPSKGLYTIDMKDGRNINGEIVIHDILGQVIYNSSVNSIIFSFDISMYSEGIYFFDIKIDNSQTTKKIILTK